MSSISEFKIAIPQADLDDLRTRLRQVRFASELPDGNDDAGLRLDYIKRLENHLSEGLGFDDLARMAISTHHGA